MYDWKAKISRLLELPGLTDEQKAAFEEHITWFEPDLIVRDFTHGDSRSYEQIIRLDLERLIEARGGAWEVGLDALRDSWNNRDGLPFRGGVRIGSKSAVCFGATPAQALCDALLSAVETKP